MLAIRTITSLLSPKTANISRGESRKKIAVEGNNKLDTVLKASKYVSYSTGENSNSSAMQISS